jgi:hypothetical protein
MKKRFAAIVAALGLAVVFAGAGTAQEGAPAESGEQVLRKGVFSSQELLRVDDSIIRRMQRLFDVAGLVFPAEVYPITVGQALEILDRLQDGSGSAAYFGRLTESWFGAGDDLALVRREAERLRASLESRALIRQDWFSFDASLAANPELYLHSRVLGSEAATDWEYGYRDRLPLVAVEGRLAVGPFFGVLDLDLKNEHNAIERAVDPALYSNIPPDAAYFDFQFPFRALLSVGDKGWGLVLGRDGVNVANGHGGNLGISGAADFYDFARFQLWGDGLRYTGMWLNLDASMDDIPALAPPAAAIESMEKNAFLHRLDISFFDKLTLGLSEAVMVGGQAPGLKLFNPFILFHDTYPWLDTPGMIGASSMLNLDVTANPFRWLRLWYQMAMNQFQTDFEKQKYAGAADAMPDAYGWLAGAEVTVPVWLGQELPPLVLGAGAEFCETNPWMYVRENAMNSWFTTRRLVSNVPGSFQMIHQPIGWRLGPDARSLQVWLEASVADLFELGLGWEYRARGENNLLSRYAEGPAAVALVTPSGIVQYENVFGFDGQVWFLHAPDVGLQVNLDVLAMENYGHAVSADRNWTDWQFAAALRFKL